MCIKWIGLHQTQWLHLDSQEQPHFPTDPFSQFTSINPENDDTTAGMHLQIPNMFYLTVMKLGKLNWRDVANSLLNATSNEDTERQLAELLDPDIFLSFPAIVSFKQEDRKPNHSEMLKWVMVIISLVLIQLMATNVNPPNANCELVQINGKFQVAIFIQLKTGNFRVSEGPIKYTVT